MSGEDRREDRRPEAGTSETDAASGRVARDTPATPPPAGIDEADVAATGARPDLHEDPEAEGRRAARADAALSTEADPHERETLGHEPDPYAHEHEPHAHEHEERRSGGLASRALAALVLILVGAGLALWALPRLGPVLPAPVAAYVMPLGATAGEVATRLDALEARLGEMQGAPGAELAEQVAQLEGMVEELRARIEALEAAPAPDAGALEGRIGEVESEVSALREAGGGSDGAAVAALREEVAALRDELAAGGGGGEGGGEAAAELRQEIESLREEMATLREQQGGGAQEEVAALRERVAALDQRLQEGGAGGAESEEIAALRERIGSLDQRLAQNGANADVEALRQQIEALQQQIEESRATGGAAEQQVTELLDRLDALEAAQEEGQALRDQALDEARRARRAATLGTALAQIDRAMTLGQPFDEALAEVSQAVEGGAPPPAILEAAEQGAPTREALKASFTSAAYEAIEASLSAEADPESVFGEVVARLQARVTGLPQEPVEGDSAPAVLSRARAALLNGNLDGALAAIDALPEPARQAMSEWIEGARLRANADAALAQWRAELKTML